MQQKGMIEFEPFLYPSAPFTEIAALISRASLLISPDTAVVHVAAAFDTPLFGLFSRYEKMTRSFYPLSSVKALVWAEDDESLVRGISAEQALRVWDDSGIYQKAANKR
jgi:ADP-heptose:LPS heptosyltransferase